MTRSHRQGLIILLLAATLYGFILLGLGAYATVFLGLAVRWMAGSLFGPLVEGGLPMVQLWGPSVLKMGLVVLVITLMVRPNERRRRPRTRQSYLDRVRMGLVGPRSPAGGSRTAGTRARRAP